MFCSPPWPAHNGLPEKLPPLQGRAPCVQEPQRPCQSFLKARDARTSAQGKRPGFGSCHLATAMDTGHQTASRGGEGYRSLRGDRDRAFCSCHLSHMGGCRCQGTGVYVCYPDPSPQSPQHPPPHPCLRQQSQPWGPSSICWGCEAAAGWTALQPRGSLLEKALGPSEPIPTPSSATSTQIRTADQ